MSAKKQADNKLESPAKKIQKERPQPAQQQAPKMGEPELSQVSLEGLPASPTNRDLRQKALLQLQRTHGNAYVQRQLRRSRRTTQTETLAQPSTQRVQGAMVQRGLFDSISSGLEAVGGAISSGVKAVGSAISSGVKAVGEAVGSLGQDKGPQALIVEDETADLAPGQMRKQEFLHKLEAAVCATSDEALSGTIYSAVGCPYITRVFSRLPNRPAEYIERMIHLFAPGTQGATSAEAYITPVTNRVRVGIANWLETGEVTGVPPELAGLGEAAAGSATGEASSATINRQVDESLQRAPEPLRIQRELGQGRPLDSSARSRMESGFGRSFRDVVIHTDAQAARLARQQDARAFTVGQHIAFGSGEYQPGTLVGDAILAHELVHTIQQRGELSGTAPIQRVSASYQALEEDADRSLESVMASLWQRGRGTASAMAQNAIPSLKSGLRLQRCNKKSSGRIGPARLEEARNNFRSHNSDLITAEKEKIDAALATVAHDNINLHIAFYDYYSSHTLGKASKSFMENDDPPWKDNEYARTGSGFGSKGKIPKGDTYFRLEAFDYPPAKLGPLLIHEFTHTRHPENVLGAADAVEGDSYGIEYFYAGRSGDTKRQEEIQKVDPRGIAGAGAPEYERRFRESYATLEGLYEIIDSGSSSHADSPFTDPSPLTPDEARALAAELVSQKEDSRSSRLTKIMAWVGSNLRRFDIPDINPKPKFDPYAH